MMIGNLHVLFWGCGFVYAINDPIRYMEKTSHTMLFTVLALAAIHSINKKGHTTRKTKIFRKYNSACYDSNIISDVCVHICVSLNLY